MLVRYYISSADLTAEKFANAMRSHWDVENKLHWRLDVAMNEDDCRIRRGNAAELFSGIRHIAVNVLTENKEFKAGLRRKDEKSGDGQRVPRVSPCGVRGFVILPWLDTGMKNIPLPLPALVIFDDALRYVLLKYLSLNCATDPSRSP